MPTTFNASTATGAVVTADSSGVLVLQSDGVTALTANGANVTVAGTLTATGGVSGVNVSTGVTGTLPIANGGTNATTAGGALTALGAYPAANPNSYTSNTGTVTGVTGTAPIVSSGGTAPAISISAATISADGSMSAADKTKLDGVATGATANTGTVTSVNLTAGTGVSVSGGPVTSSGAITVTNTAPDQVVSLTGAGTTTITGTYPSFTITSADSTVGTVTSVGGTGTINGITLTGSVTASGSLTLGGTLSGVDLTSQVTGTLPVANGGTGAATLTGYVKGTGTSAMTASAAIPVADVTGAAPLASPTFTGTVTTATADLLGSVRSNITTVAASAVDCSLGNYFIKTATGALTWTATNVPATRAYSFILELTNGGAGAQTWYSGIKWPGGTAPTLVASGVDVLGFITDDGGTTWRGVQLMKDSK